jgi:hypothetical protein
VTTEITWPQALAWRMERHLLEPVGTLSVPRVVRRLCAVQAQVASSAELAVRVRRRSSRAGEVARALSDGRLIKTWAMRGTLHLLTPEDAGVYLSLIASGRSWERPSWQKYFGVSPKQIEQLRSVVRDALAGEVLTREELVAAVTRRKGLRHVGEALSSGWGTLLKPLAWQGDLCFGPSRGNRVTFRLPEEASSRWAGLPEAEEAAPIAIANYLRAYGPASIRAFGGWLAGGWFGTRQLKRWFDELGDCVAEVIVDGEPMSILAEDLDSLTFTRPTKPLRLLPGFDQYVLGPGTGDPHVVPPGRRSAISRQSGWIAPVVVAGGVVRGSWELDGERLRVEWFRESGPIPRAALRAEVERLSTILGRALRVESDLV